MKTKWIFSLGIISGLVILGFLLVVFKQPYVFKGSEILPPLPIQNFILTDQFSKTFYYNEYQGEVLLISFGYTNCPDVCPLTLAKFQQVKQKLGSRADEVRFIFITVDPERDTPQVLRDYLGYFDSDFIGLSGARSELENVWPLFGV
jgi:protein SCO1/2